MNTHLYKMYYSVLGVGLLSATIITIYFGGLLVVRSNQQAELATQQRALTAYKHSLQQEIASATSLSKLKVEVSTAGYAPIAGAVMVTPPHSVASR